MADISKIVIPNGSSTTTYDFKDATMRTEITNARGSYTNLDSRLDAIDTGLAALIARLEATL